jgi:hypothetical protein
MQSFVELDSIGRSTKKSPRHVLAAHLYFKTALSLLHPPQLRLESSWLEPPLGPVILNCKTNQSHCKCYIFQVFNCTSLFS